MTMKFCAIRAQAWAKVGAVAFIGLTCFQGAGTALAAPSDKSAVRVMPLGDSITDGFTVPGGYRTELWQDLTAHHLRVDFVGSQANGPESLGSQHHEGHPGWRIRDIQDKINVWMHDSQPQIVLLQIGTNDFNRNDDPSHAPDRLNTLLKTILSDLPTGGRLYVDQITPEANPVWNTQILDYNQHIAALVSAYAHAGKPIRLVNMYKVLTVADLSDGVHPTPAGYAKMGDVWFNAIRQDVAQREH